MTTENPKAPKQDGAAAVACTDLLACECANWTSRRLDIRLLTNHHESCPKGDVMGSAKSLIRALVKGLEAWGAEEDGIYPEAWEAYKRGKAVIGEFDWKEDVHANILTRTKEVSDLCIPTIPLLLLRLANSEVSSGAKNL
jgi:hypothetical protein